jgi:hypothetical protein
MEFFPNVWSHVLQFWHVFVPFLAFAYVPGVVRSLKEEMRNQQFNEARF